MGGFHGGHSGGGGGGFHGGSHSSFSHHSYSHSSHSHYSGGIFISNRSINVSGGSRKASIPETTFIGILLIIIGIISFLFIATPRHTIATIIDTDIATDSYEKYEVYDFEYYVNGIRYTGYGDDDLNADGTLSIEVGEKYTLYLRLLGDTSYSFSDQTPTGFLIGGVLSAFGIFAIAHAVKAYVKFRKELAEVGDANGDGKVDKYDIEYAKKKKTGMADGAYDGARDATAENVYDELRKEKPKRVCPYCGSLVGDEHLFCVQCGGRLSEDNKK